MWANAELRVISSTGQRYCKLAVTFLLFLLLASPLGFAQTITGTIVGTVKDTTGAVVPGASLEIKNTDTGVARTTQTDERGFYRAPQLSPGNYQVQASSTGFKTQVRQGITLTVAQEATVDLVLEVGAVTETVTVMGEAPLVETTGMSTMGGLVTSQAVESLPLNGRSFEQLAILQPGVVANTQSGGTFNLGRTRKISIGGARGSQNTFLLDGTTIDNRYNSTPGSVVGNLLGVETVREFRVLANNYGAEYGKNAGGVVNIVTRSGTNTIHGSVYEFLRNSSLDAKNFFDSSQRPIPPFKRNQFGAALGGSIQKDHLFYYLNYEGFRERLGISNVSPVPDEEARRGFLPDPANPSERRFVPIDPVIQPYLNLFPFPNSPRRPGPGVGEWLGSSTQPAREDFFSARLDYNISEKDSLFGRLTFSDAEINPVTLALPLFGSDETSRLWYVTLQHTHIFSPTVLNTARFGFARNALFMQGAQRNFLGPIDPSLNFRGAAFPFGTSGGINISPLAAGIRGNPLSANVLAPITAVLNTFEYSDYLDWSSGSHTFKAGVKVSRLRDNTGTGVFSSWLYLFTTLENFYLNRPLFIFGTPADADAYRGLRYTMYAGFIQDDIRLTPNLSVSLGLRYENMRPPMEVNGKYSCFCDPSTGRGRITDLAPTVLGKGPRYEDHAKLGFTPRVGLSWNPFGNGKTVVRAGWGAFLDQLTPFAYSVGLPPFAGRGLIFGATFPTTVVTARPPFQIESDDYNHIPYVMHYNFQIQRQLGQSMEFTIGYEGSTGVHLIIPMDAGQAEGTILPDGRKFFPPGTVRVSPSVSESSVKVTGAHSTYNALVLAFDRRFSGGLAAQVNYTFSHSIDDSTDEFTNTSRSGRKNTQDSRDFRRSRSTGTFDRTHIFNTNVVYELPFGKGRAFGGNLTGAAERLLGGWELSAIISANSGPPVVITEEIDRSRSGVPPGVNTGHRPDLCPGKSNNPRLGDPSKWFSPDSFCLQPEGFFGNLGRNTGRGPALATLDFAVRKATKISERFGVEFESQFFNLFNHPNFDVPSNAVFGDASGRPLATFGVITSTATTSRQIQFGLKLVF